MKTKSPMLLLIALCACLLFPPACLSENKAILISGSPSYTPFYYRDAEGNITGLFVDIWKLWGQKVDKAVQFEAQPFTTVLDDVGQGRADIVAGFFKSEERARQFGYSQPFYKIPTHIFFHQQVYGLKHITDLAGFTIGIVKGDYAESYVRQKLPESKLALYDRYDALVKAAVSGDIKVFICDTPVAFFFLNQYGHADDFKHTAQPLYTSNIHAGVKIDNIALLDLINEGFGRISQEEFAAINRRWKGVGVHEHPYLWPLLGIGLLAVILCASGLMLWNHQLRRRVAVATSDLKKQRKELEAGKKLLQRGNDELEDRVRRRTEQMEKANQLLAEQIEKHTRTEDRLARNNAYLSDLHKTMLDLMRRLDLQELLEAIVKRVTAATGTQHGYVYLKNTDSDELVARTGTGLFATALGYRLKPGQGLAGKVLQSGRYLLVEDYRNWPGRHPAPYWDGLGAVIGIPLISGDQVVGVIGLCFMQAEGTFGEDEIAFLNGFAELASIALDNAQLYEALQNELAEGKRNEIERKRLEERVQQAHKMEAVGTLAGGIAHDFNNILAVIMGNLEIAMEDIPADSMVQSCLRDGFESTIRGRDLVQQILTFGRKGTIETQPIEVESAIRQGIKLIRASIPASIEIREHLKAKNAIVNASPVQIQQVLMNLSTNAAHAMEESGGFLDFQLKETELNGEFSKQNPQIRPGRYAQLTIRDSGHGIPPDVMPRIFEPYFTTKEMDRGTGLGLSVVHGIVQSHNGLILAESTPGQGTKFEIYLPLFNGFQPDQSEMVFGTTKGEESLLFVDDEPELVTVCRKALENKGYQVTTCSDGQEALELFNQAPGQFDLVITDMTMPRLNGDKLAIQILDQRPELPIIMCTGFSHLMSTEKARQIGIRTLLMKPVFIRDLLATIRQVLDNS